MRNLCTLAVLGALASSATTASAAFTQVQSDRFAFIDQIQSVGFDHLDDLHAPGMIESPLQRNAGAHGYAADSPGGLYALRGHFGAAGGTFVDGESAAISTGAPQTPLLLNNFSTDVYAIGLQLYATRADGSFWSAPVRMTVTDSRGSTINIWSEYDVVSSGTFPNFIGLVSESPITSVQVWVPDPAGFPTIDNVVLGSIATVPEPLTSAMFAAGLLVLGLRHRRLPY